VISNVNGWLREQFTVRPVSLTVVLVCIFSLLGAPAFAEDQYTVFEYRLSALDFPQVSNPYDPDQLRVDLRVTSPSGTQLVPAFFEGAGAEPFPQAGFWVGRYYLLDSGTHTAQFMVNGVPSGPVKTFQSLAQPASTDRRLQLSRVHSNFLARGDQPFLLKGHNHPFFGGAEPLQSSLEYLPELASNSANTLRVWLDMEFSLALEAKFPWPTNQFEGVNRYNQQRAKRLDQILAAFEENDVYLMLAVFTHCAWTNNPIDCTQWTKSAYNANNYTDAQIQATPGLLFNSMDVWTNPDTRRLMQKKVRYVMARWGAYPHFGIFELWNEADNYGLFPRERHNNNQNEADAVRCNQWLETRRFKTDMASWHNDMYQYAKSLRPNKLVTTSLALLDHARDAAEHNLWKPPSALEETLPSYCPPGTQLTSPREAIRVDLHGAHQYAGRLYNDDGVSERPEMLSEWQVQMVDAVPQRTNVVPDQPLFFAEAGMGGRIQLEEDSNYDFFRSVTWLPVFHYHTGATSFTWDVAYERAGGARQFHFEWPEQYAAILRTFSDLTDGFPQQNNLQAIQTRNLNNSVRVGGYTSDSEALLYFLNQRFYPTISSTMLGITDPVNMNLLLRRASAYSVTCHAPGTGAVVYQNSQLAFSLMGGSAASVTIPVPAFTSDLFCRVGIDHSAPPAIEICNQSGDEDGNGLADCADPACAASCSDTCPAVCGDVDGNGIVNGTDPAALETYIQSSIPACVAPFADVQYPQGVISQADADKIANAVLGGWAQWLSCSDVPAPNPEPEPEPDPEPEPEPIPDPEPSDCPVMCGDADANGNVDSADVSYLETALTNAGVPACVLPLVDVQWPEGSVDSADVAKISQAVTEGWAQWLDCPNSSTPQPEPDPDPEPVTCSTICGDINADNVVTAADVTLLREQLNNTAVSACSLSIGDVEWPFAVVDSRDANKIEDAVNDGWAQWLSCQ